jgi:hypothetical protein
MNHIFFKSFRAKKMNQLVVTSYKLKNNFVGIITSVLGPDVARGPPVVPRWCKVSIRSPSCKVLSNSTLSWFDFSSFRIMN